jgi:alpha-glucosidase (family GH31 glycosyl hydrolase)
MEVHGLGIREPWLFQPDTLDIYRRYAQLHVQLVPYTLAASVEANETGMPLMRAMALSVPDDPRVHEEWIAYQYLYGSDLLVAPVYSLAKERQVYFPAGGWIDHTTGERSNGPASVLVQAPLEKLPLFVREGALLPLLENESADLREALALDLYPGDLRPHSTKLPDGTEITLTPLGERRATLATNGPQRRYSLRAPFGLQPRLEWATTQVDPAEGRICWSGNALLRLAMSR